MKIAVIFPVRNEAKTIAKCVATARESQYHPEVLVVDGYSTDGTREEAASAGASVITQSEGIYPAKGRAIKDGVQAAAGMGIDLITFLDGDIVNLTTDWVDLLVEPVLADKCDMSRGFYRRAEYDGVVTKLVAKPLGGIFFPEVAHLEQPLSGEICAPTQLFEMLAQSPDCPNGWGIDIWLLIETAMRDKRIKEIYLGTKIHTSRQDYFEDVARLAKMSEQVAVTIIKEAVKYRRIDNIKNESL